MPGKHQQFYDVDAASLADTLEEMTEKISDLMEYAEGEGYLAVAHKLEEGWGRVNNACTAARQYEIGELTR